MFADVCEAGTYRSNATACLPCGIGSFSKAGDDICTECPPGQTTLEEGTDTCISKITTGLCVLFFLNKITKVFPSLLEIRFRNI